MADNKRWFKVWTSILSDPGFDELPNDCAGVWIKLGALIAKHGCNGNITVTKTQFQKRTNTLEKDLPYLQQHFKNINVDIDVNGNSNISVTFKKWKHYQENTDSYERVKRWREKQIVTVACNVTKEKEKEKEKDKEKDKEEKKIIKKHTSKLSDEEWIQSLKQNSAYKGIDIEKEQAKCITWFQTKGITVTRRRFLNWLNRADKPLMKGNKNGTDREGNQDAYSNIGRAIE